MRDNLAQELRESAKATFYDPLKSELSRAADHIEKLEAGEEEWNRICNSYAARIDELERELKRLIDYGLVSFQDLDRARAVLGETCSD